MKTIFTAIVVVIFAGCQPTAPKNEVTAQPSVPLGAPIPTPKAAQANVKFEVRDFKLEEQNDSPASKLFKTVTTKGRGILVAKDDALKTGNFMIWLAVKQAHKDDEKIKFFVLLTGGIGTFETFDIESREDMEKKKIKYFDWEIVGFVKLQDGVIATNESAISK